MECSDLSEPFLPPDWALDRQNQLTACWFGGAIRRDEWPTRGTGRQSFLLAGSRTSEERKAGKISRTPRSGRSIWTTSDLSAFCVQSVNAVGLPDRFRLILGIVAFWPEVLSAADGGHVASRMHRVAERRTPTSRRSPDRNPETTRLRRRGSFAARKSVHES